MEKDRRQKRAGPRGDEHEALARARLLEGLEERVRGALSHAVGRIDDDHARRPLRAPHGPLCEDDADLRDRDLRSDLSPARRRSEPQLALVGTAERHDAHAGVEALVLHGPRGIGGLHDGEARAAGAAGISAALRGPRTVERARERQGDEALPDPSRPLEEKRRVESSRLERRAQPGERLLVTDDDAPGHAFSLP